MADEVFEVTGTNPLLDIALELERIALEDEYFVKRKLYPNVDFYSGIIYQAMGFPVDMFPVLFAIPRTPGWLAQWQEMLHRHGAEDRAAAADLHRPRRADLPGYERAQAQRPGLPGAPGEADRRRLIAASIRLADEAGGDRRVRRFGRSVVMQQTVVLLWIGRVGTAVACAVPEQRTGEALRRTTYRSPHRRDRPASAR